MKVPISVLLMVFMLGCGVPGLRITTYQASPTVVGNKYTAHLQATGGTPPYIWSVQGGNLPTGLSLSSTGLLTGTPTASGTWTATIQVKDSSVGQ